MNGIFLSSVSVNKGSHLDPGLGESLPQYTPIPFVSADGVYFREVGNLCISFIQ